MEREEGMIAKVEALNGPWTGKRSKKVETDKSMKKRTCESCTHFYIDRWVQGPEEGKVRGTWCKLYPHPESKAKEDYCGLHETEREKERSRELQEKILEFITMPKESSFIQGEFVDVDEVSHEGEVIPAVPTLKPKPKLNEEKDLGEVFIESLMKAADKAEGKGDE